MKTQQGLILNKEVEGKTLTLTHLKGNTFQLTTINGIFSIGKGAYYNDGQPINQPEINKSVAIITKAEMKRLGTYKMYLNGKDVSSAIFGKWIDRKGRQIIFMDENDVYYYFNRPDCGLVQVNNISGEHCITKFHYSLGRDKDRSGSEIEVLEK